MEQLTKRADVARSTIHGWGLFARRPIRAGETIDETPIALYPPDLDERLFDRFYEVDEYNWGLPTGDGAVVNSSDDPNARWEIVLVHEKTVVRLVATKDLLEGEEVTIRYAA